MNFTNLVRFSVIVDSSRISFSRSKRISIRAFSSQEQAVLFVWNARANLYKTLQINWFDKNTRHNFFLFDNESAQTRHTNIYKTPISPDLIIYCLHHKFVHESQKVVIIFCVSNFRCSLTWQQSCSWIFKPVHLHDGKNQNQKEILPILSTTDLSLTGRWWWWCRGGT